MSDLDLEFEIAYETMLQESLKAKSDGKRLYIPKALSDEQNPDRDQDKQMLEMLIDHGMFTADSLKCAWVAVKLEDMLRHDYHDFSCCMATIAVMEECMPEILPVLRSEVKQSLYHLSSQAGAPNSQPIDSDEESFASRLSKVLDFPKKPQTE